MFLPAFDIPSPRADRAPYIGLAVLVLGAVGNTLSWLANPLLFIAWSQLGKGRGVIAFFLAVFAFLLSLSFLRGGQLPAGSEGLYPYRILAGLYVWPGAIVLTGVSGLFFETANVAVDDAADTVPCPRTK